MSTQTAEADAPDTSPAHDGPLLDLTDAGVKKFIKQAKARGYVTMDELNKVLPSEEVTSEQIEDTLAMLSEMGVNVVEAEEDAEKDGEGGEVAVREETQIVETPKEAAYDRTDDPVRMYLREMGSVELLSREGEIAIAKRIEAGRDTMIRGLCESALTFEAIMVWRDEPAERPHPAARNHRPRTDLRWSERCAADRQYCASTRRCCTGARTCCSR